MQNRSQQVTQELNAISREANNYKKHEAEAIVKPIDLSPHAIPELLPEDFHVIPSPQEGRTVTVFLCGTCATRHDYLNKARYFNGENVSHTFSITEGEEYIDKIIVDGVGTDEDKNDAGELVNDSDKLWVPYKRYSRKLGIGLAYGQTERIEHILAVLKNDPQIAPKNQSPEMKAIQAKLAIANKEKPITRVNIVGWSRGAAAGITLANRMFSDPQLSHIECNLVLLDPVPGVGLSNKFNRKLNVNVKNCVTIFAKDERSGWFNPVVVDCHKDMKFIPIVLPGGHAHVAGDECDHGGKKVDGANLRSSGRIARFMMQRFLSHYATQFKPNTLPITTLSNLIAEYKIMQEYLRDYVIGATRVPYTFNQLSGEDRKFILGDQYWLNQYFSTVRETMLPKHSAEYFDGVHQQICEAVENAQKITKEISQALNSCLMANRQITNEDKNRIKSILANYPTLEKDELGCVAVCEALQQQWRPYDLLDFTKRHASFAELKNYLAVLVDERCDLHNAKTKEFTVFNPQDLEQMRDHLLQSALDHKDELRDTANAINKKEEAILAVFQDRKKDAIKLAHTALPQSSIDTINDWILRDQEARATGTNTQRHENVLRRHILLTAKNVQKAEVELANLKTLADEIRASVRFDTVVQLKSDMAAIGLPALAVEFTEYTDNMTALKNKIEIERALDRPPCLHQREDGTNYFEQLSEKNLNEANNALADLNECYELIDPVKDDIEAHLTHINDGLKAKQTKRSRDKSTLVAEIFVACQDIEKRIQQFKTQEAAMLLRSKTKLRDLLTSERQRITNSFKLFSSSESTAAKLAAIDNEQRALAATQNLAELKEKANGLLANNSIAQSRSLFKSLPFFKSESTMKKKLTQFLDDNELNANARMEIRR